MQLSDAGTGKVLDTETISAFTSGVYLDWKVSGNLLITITRTAGANAVLNGLFLDGTTPSSSAIQTAAASGGEAGVPISVSTANRPIVGRASVGYPSRSAGGLVDVVLGALLLTPTQGLLVRSLWSMSWSGSRPSHEVESRAVVGATEVGPSSGGQFDDCQPVNGKGQSVAQRPPVSGRNSMHRAEGEPLDITYVLDRNPGLDIGESLPVPHRADAFVPLSM